MIDHIQIDPGRFQAVINIYLNLSLALNSTEAKQFKTRAEYRDYLVIKATAEAYQHIGILLIMTLIYGRRMTMKITIKWNVDSKSDEEVKKVMALLKNVTGTLIPFSDQDPDPNDEITAEQLIHTIKSRDDKIQDLKLDNDRLKQRNELMEDFIHVLACNSKNSKYYGLCDSNSCPYYDHNKVFGQGACKLCSLPLIDQEAAKIIKQLEAL